jgi:ABC-type nitrate/sulfonate/bicarbonate transport system permease component
MNGRALALPLTILAIWESAGRTIALPTDSTTRPSDIASALISAAADGSLLKATSETLGAAAGGFAMAVVFGVGLAIPLGLSASLRNVISPSIELLRPVPPVALIPLGILMFGFGPSMETMIVSFACIWPVLGMSIAAVRGIEPRLIEVARNFELSVNQRIIKIVLPFIVPRLFVGLRLAAGVALVVAVTVEIAANPRGLGYELILAQQNLRPDRAYGLLLWIGCLGWALNTALTRFERTTFGHLDPVSWGRR